MSSNSISQQIKPVISSPLFGVILALLAIAILAAVGPAEKSLGPNVRVVYLHGAWVWAALVSYFSAAVAGLIGLIFKRESFHLWSRALGRTGLIFWITYLPLSLWAMQTNWNGLFLAEPRWRIALIFTVGGLVLQIGVSLMENLTWSSVANLIFWLAMVFALASTENVMHPGSPIFGSDATRIQYFFLGLLGTTLIAAGLIARWLYLSDKAKIQLADR